METENTQLHDRRKATFPQDVRETAYVRLRILTRLCVGLSSRGTLSSLLLEPPARPRRAGGLQEKKQAQA